MKIDFYTHQKYSGLGRLVGLITQTEVQCGCCILKKDSVRETSPADMAGGRQGGTVESHSHHVGKHPHGKFIKGGIEGRRKRKWVGSEKRRRRKKRKRKVKKRKGGGACYLTAREERRKREGEGLALKEGIT